MDGIVRRTATQQGRRLARPFALLVVIMTLFGMFPGGLADVGAQSDGNQTESDTQQGQQAGPAETTYLEIHVLECPADFDGTGGDEYYNACHSIGLANVDVTLSGDGLDEAATTEVQDQDGPGIALFDGLAAGDYDVTVDPGQDITAATVYTYCSVADGDAETPVSPDDALDAQVTIPDGEAVVCDWYIVPAAGDAQGTTIDLTGLTCDTGTFEPGSNPSREELARECTSPAEGVEFTVVSGPDETETTETLDAGGAATLAIDPTGDSRIYADVELEADEWMYCSTGDGDPSQVTLDEEGVWNVQPGSPQQLDCTWYFSDVPAETPVSTPEEDETPASTPDEGDQAGTSTLTIAGFTCPDGAFEPGSSHDQSDLALQCTDPAAGIGWTVLTGPDASESTATTAGDGTVTFEFDPATETQVYANVELKADEWMFCSNGDTEAGQVTFDDQGTWNIQPGERQDLACTWYFSDVPATTPEPTVEPTTEPTAVPTKEAANPDSTVEAAGQGEQDANDTGGQQVPAGQQPGQQGPERARISVLATTCIDGFDPEASGVEYDVLVENCSEPLENVSFNLTAPDGSVNTKVTDGANPVDYTDLADGTYSLYSGIPLEAASEYAFCRQDGGDRYQRDFNDVGVTTFSDLAGEQIECQWFVVQNNLRGEETGASLEIHYGECPAGYNDNAYFNDCHGRGIAGKRASIQGGGDEQSTTTVVEQTPGPGIARFTALAPDTYALAVEQDTEGRTEIYCSVQPSDETVIVDRAGGGANVEVGENDHVLCDWFFIPAGNDETPAPPSRAEITVTLYACPATSSGYGGATSGDYAANCKETVNDVPYTLGEQGAPPLTANTGASGDGAVRFFDLLAGDYTMTPNLPDNLTSSAVFCQIGEGDEYQKALGNGSTTFDDVNGESISCRWYAVKDPEQQPAGPSGSITIRERLCASKDIKDYDAECAAGGSGSSFTLASSDGSVTLEGTPNGQGVYVFSGLGDGFYSLKQNTGTWCKAVADRVDSKSRVIVESGANTDVVFYQCGPVTGLPTTGTGPAGTVQGDDQPLISAEVWTAILSVVAVILAGAGALQFLRARKQVQAPVRKAQSEPVVTPSGRVRMRFR